MRTTLREIAAWAPVAAALSLLLYAVALMLWPQQAGHLFATLFSLDELTWLPAHGWAAVAFGIVVWAGASYLAAAAVWSLWHLPRRAPHGILPDAQPSGGRIARLFLKMARP